VILTEEEVKVLEKLLTCSKCGSRLVEIEFQMLSMERRRVKGCYVKCCLNCGYCEKLEGLEWNEED